MWREVAGQASTPECIHPTATATALDSNLPLFRQAVMQARNTAQCSHYRLASTNFSSALGYWDGCTRRMRNDDQDDFLYNLPGPWSRR